MSYVGVIKKQEGGEIQVPLGGGNGAQPMLYTTLGGKKQLPLVSEQKRSYPQIIEESTGMGTGKIHQDATSGEPLIERKPKKYVPQDLVEQAAYTQSNRPLPENVAVTPEQIYDIGSKYGERAGKLADLASNLYAGTRFLTGLQRGTATGQDALSALGGAALQGYTTRQTLNPIARRTGADVGAKLGRKVAIDRANPAYFGDREISRDYNIKPPEPIVPYVAPPSVHAGYTPTPKVTEIPLNFPTEADAKLRREQMGLAFSPTIPQMGTSGYPMGSKENQEIVAAQSRGLPPPSIVGGALNVGMPKASPTVAPPTVASPTGTGITDNQAVKELSPYGLPQGQGTLPTGAPPKQEMTDKEAATGFINAQRKEQSSQTEGF